MSEIRQPGVVRTFRGRKTTRPRRHGRRLPGPQPIRRRDYSDFDKLEKDAAKVNRQAGGVYVTLNRINPELLARRENRYEPYATTTTSDDQVVLRRWFPIDLDPVRPAGISASNEEHNATIELARQIRRYLVQELGWPQPVAADSGNGAHLLFRIELPNDADAAGLVQAGLQALHLKFSDDKIAVDTGNYNAARIWKLYGTVAGKGDHTESRPHRVARLLYVPEVVEVVPIEKLRALAAIAPRVNGDHRQPGRSTPSQYNANGHLDVGEWLKQHSIPVLYEREYSGQLGRGRKWILARCLWNPDHNDKSAFIIQFENGEISAGCAHNGCQGKSWRDLRDAVEPGWRQRRTGRAAHTAASPTAKAGRNRAAPPPWRPFPVEVLPDPVRGFVAAGAKVIVCDPSYVALPMLSGLAAAALTIDLAGQSMSVRNTTSSLAKMHRRRAGVLQPFLYRTGHKEGCQPCRKEENHLPTFPGEHDRRWRRLRGRH